MIIDNMKEILQVLGYWPSVRNLHHLKNAFSYLQSRQDLVAAQKAKRGSLQWNLYFHPIETSMLLIALFLLIFFALSFLNVLLVKNIFFGFLLVLLLFLFPFFLVFLTVKVNSALKLPSNKQGWKIAREKFDEMCLKEGKLGEEVLNEILRDLLLVNQRYIRLMEVFFLSSLLNASIKNCFLMAILNLDVFQAYKISHLGAVSLVMLLVFSFLAYFVVWIPLIRARALSQIFN